MTQRPEQTLIVLIKFRVSSMAGIKGSLCKRFDSCYRNMLRSLRVLNSGKIDLIKAKSLCRE